MRADTDIAPLTNPSAVVANVVVRVVLRPRRGTQHCPYAAVAPTAIRCGREADRSRAPWTRRRIRRPRHALPPAPARLLPQHDALERGRGGRASGGLRQRLPGNAR